MPDPKPLDAKEWDRLCQRAEKAVRKALVAEGLKVVRHGGGTHRDIGLAMGAVVASADLLRAMCSHPGSDMRVAEAMAVAYVRGVIRGLDHPVNADGTDYQGAPIYDA